MLSSKNVWFIMQAKLCGCLLKSNSVHTSAIKNGRYGHRLIKLWEQEKYTVEPLKVFRTGGRMPNKNRFGEIVPGRVWTPKLGGGMDKDWFWVDRHRLTVEDVENEMIYHERVLKIMEDESRAAHIALVAGPLKRRWVLATSEMKPGQLIKNSTKPEPLGVEYSSGDAYPLKHIPVKTKVCNVEKTFGKGAVIARSAGTYCTITNHQRNGGTLLEMPSKREIIVSSDCIATVGIASNGNHSEVHWGSAQQLRYYGVRPCSGKYVKRDGRHGKQIWRHRRPVFIRTVLKDEGSIPEEDV